MLKRILIGLGGSEHVVPAINRAVTLALPDDAKLNGISIIDVGQVPNVGPVPLGGG